MIRLSLQFYPDDLQHPDHGDFKRMRLREMSTALVTLRDIIEMARQKIEDNDVGAPEEFTDGKWLNSDEKRKLLKRWKHFVKNGFPESLFTTALYEHFHLHCGYIAHYNKRGYWSEYWGALDFHRHAQEDNIVMRPVPLTFSRWESFLRQFNIWGEYTDINRAMMVVLKEELELLVKDILEEAGHHLAADMGQSYELYLQAKTSMVERATDLRRQADEVEQVVQTLTSEGYSESIKSKYAELFGESIVFEKAVSQLSLI